MALSDIQTIFFDIGSTLRVTDKDPAFIAEGRRKLAALAKSDEDPEVFYKKLKDRYDAYREVSKVALLDYPEIELWQQIMLPDVDGEYVAAHAQEFTTLWRDGTNGKRMTRFDTVDTIKELYRRGYKLGIIANTITEAEITDWMIEEGISHYFTTTILSSKVRLRKPDPAIYHLSCRCCGTPEANCAYIGDNPDRDVEGTRAAGFGCMILIDDPKKGRTEKMREACDYLIENLSDLLDLFPDRTREKENRPMDNTKRFKAVFFDLGGTLRIALKDEPYMKHARRKMAEIAGTDMPYEEFFQLIEDRYEPYRKWALSEFKESDDEELWCKWLLPDYDPVRIKQVCHELSYQYRQTKGRRVVVDGGVEVIKGLHERGYKLGIISNLIGETEVPDWLEEDGLDQYFDSVILSSVCHLRKPGFEIYQLCAKEMGVELADCVSVADNVKRDIPGAKKAGVGCNIIFESPEKKHAVEFTEETRPDAIIKDFREILDLLPPLN